MPPTPLIWSNLDMEYALARGESWRPSKHVARRLDRWTYLLRAIPGLHHARTWTPSPHTPPPPYLTSWGVDHRTLPQGADPAQLETIRRANDKRTLLAIEPAHNALPYTRLIEDERALRDAITSTPHAWILKHPFGVSGRERAVGEPGQLDPRQLAWATKQWRSSTGALLFEPRCAIEEEFSWHVDLDKEGTTHLIGRCTLLVDRQGTHRGHVVTHEDLAAPLPDMIADTLTALHDIAPYTGPLSTDGFLATLGDKPVRRYISEINARYTFGRIALELARGYVDTHPEHAFSWLHFSDRALGELPTDLSTLPPYPISPHARATLSPGWYKLPTDIDPHGTSGSAILLMPAAHDSLDDANLPTP